jgi:peptidoglycan/xylan/chitin deacetylase (PgdA/CDA1 family)
MARMPLLRSDASQRVVVLLYHSIHRTKGFASATPALFEEHIEWLKEHCDIILFEEALTIAGKPGRTRPSVAIAFDDGYADVHEHGLPVLARLGIEPTVFPTIGLVDGDPRVVARMAELQGASSDEVAGMSWSQLLETQQAGMTVGSHGLSHPNLARLGDEMVRFEAAHSKLLLEEKLGKRVNSFAYPFGKPKHHVTARTMQEVASCGYTVGGTAVFRRVRSTDDPMAIPRFPVNMDSIQTLEAKVMGRFDLLGMYQLYTPVWISRIISPETSAWT